MENREFLQLAHNIRKTDCVSGWFMSEKLDGMRAFWDGGISAGKPINQVPWANQNKKGHLKTEPVSTGLWSRYGNVIHAPQEWLNKLPKVMLDGELFLGRGMFQKLVSITKRHTPDLLDWEAVQFVIIDSPLPQQVFADGRINNPQFQTIIKGVEFRPVYLPTAYEASYHRLRELAVQYADSGLVVIEQQRLNYSDGKAEEEIYERMTEVLKAGGEGVIVRNPAAPWTPKRTRHVLKVKNILDAEAAVVGYIAGQGKHLGRLGALMVQWEGKRFKIGTGFDDAERTVSGDFSGWYTSNPGSLTTDGCWLYPIGSKVTFAYRELSDDGVPKEARFIRKA